MTRVRYSGTPEERFCARVQRGDGCWEWQGYRAIRRGQTNGHGKFSLANGQPVLAHRYAYELWVGPIPDGMVVHHRCENPSCVRPDHLELKPPGVHLRDHALERGVVRNQYGEWPVARTAEEKRIRDRDWMRRKREEARS